MAAVVLVALWYGLWAASGLGAQGAGLPAAVTFLAPVAFETGEYGPGDVERADLNNDGLPDLAVFTTGNGPGIQFHIGEGNGRLQKANTLGVAYGSSIASGDFNNDGRRDLVVTQATAAGITRYTDLYCDPVSPAADYPAAILFLGVAGATPFPSSPSARITASACLHAPASSASLTDATAGHFDADGYLDLAVGFATSGLRVYRGNGDGTFMAPVQAIFPLYAPTSAKPFMGSPLTAVDLDVDGRLDLVADLGGSPAILRNTGDGTAAHPWGQFTHYRTYGVGGVSLPFQSAQHAFSVGDFNRDGIPDIAGVQSGSSALGGIRQYFVYVSLGTGNIGDGLVDPGEENPNVGDTARFQLDTRNFPPSFPALVTGGPINVGGMALADFNRDGVLDLAAVHRAGNSVVVYRGYGDGALTTGTPITVGPAGHQPRFATAADWNGDTWLDLAIVDTGSEGGGGSFTWALIQVPGTADSVPPAVTLTAPVGGSTLEGAVTLAAEASDDTGVSRVEFYRGTILIATDTSFPYDAIWSTAAVSNGSYTLTAKAYDLANNLSTSGGVPVTVANPDTTAPAVNLTAPAAGSTLSGAVAALTASATDLNGVTRVEFFYQVPGGALTAIGTDATPPSPFTIAWSTETLAAGSYLLTARADDTATPANVGTSAPVAVTIDRPPTADAGPDQTVEATGPTGALVTLAGTGTDPDAGDPLTYRWTDGSVVLGTTPTLGVTTPLGGSVYALRVTDSHGAFADDSVAIAVDDTTPPSLVLPANHVHEATSADGFTVQSYGVSASDLVDEAPLITCSPGPPFTFPLGTTSVTCVAQDFVSNTSAEGVFSVTVQDTTAPTVALTSPVAGGHVTGIVPVEAAASDPTGVTTVELFAGTQSLGVDGTAPYGVTWDTSALVHGAIVVLRAVASDAYGHSAESTVSVTVDHPDVTPPVVAAPAAVTVAATEIDGARANVPASEASQALAAFLAGGRATDDRDSPAGLTRLAPRATIEGTPVDVDVVTRFPVGTTTVTFRYRDRANNIGIGSSAVTVTPGVGGPVTTDDDMVTATDAGNVPQPISASFARVRQHGLMTAIEMLPPAPPPAGFAFVGGVYDVVTTALVDAPIEVCLQGSGFHAGGLVEQFENGAWVDRTDPAASTPNQLCATLTALSPMAIVMSTAPPTVAVAQPPTPTNLRSGATTFTVINAATVTCQLDGGDRAPCASPFSWTSLDESVHTLTVTAVNAFGASTSETVSWTIDVTAPVLTIVPPATRTTNHSGSTTFTAGDAVTVSCQLDGGLAAACTSPYSWSDLTVGLHTLTITAADAPGNSSTASVSWTIDAPPIVTVDTTAATTGGTVTAIIANGPGQTRDWVGLYATGGSTLLDWKYLNGSQTAPAAGLTAASLPFTMPTTPGAYALRLYTAGSTLLATSASITVAVPGATLAVTPTSIGRGGTVMATVSGGPANRLDWLAVYPEAGPTYQSWVYLNGTQTAPAGGLASAAVPVTMPLAAGTYTIKLFTGSTLLATSAAISVTAAAPSVSVDATTVAPGGTVSATVANGPGARTDWVALYAGAASTYLDWRYLNGSQTAPASGMTSATIGVTMPATPGAYVLRFYTGSTLLATSATITVTAPPANATITATPATVSPGGTVSTTVANGPGVRTDWVALYAEGASTYLDWRYLNGSQTAPASGMTNATIGVTMPATPGAYVLRFHTGSTLLATSATITVTAPASATITATPATVGPGGIVTASIANGPGNRTDWVALFRDDASTYLNWKYLNGTQVAPATGLTDAALTWTMPSTPGSYTLRLFAGSTLLATSAAIAVALPAAASHGTIAPMPVAPERAIAR